MSEWKTRRFWTSAAVTETEGGFGVALDGRRVRTPGKDARFGRKYEAPKRTWTVR